MSDVREQRIEKRRQLSEGNDTEVGIRNAEVGKWNRFALPILYLIL